MAIGQTSNYRMMIDQSDSDFMRDQLTLRIVQHVDGGYKRVKLTVEIDEQILDPHVRESYTEDALTPSKIPMELAELLLNGLARYILSSEGDVVQTIRRLTHERDRGQRQLDRLIAGIGRMGGMVDDRAST